MKKTITLLALCLIGTLAFAQAPAIEWQKCLGGTGYESARSIQSTADGGYIITTNTSYFDGYYVIKLDICIFKLTSTGTLEWQKTLGGTNIDEAYSTKQTNDGGYIVVGFTSSNDGDVTGNPSGSDAWIVKLTSFGDIEWQKTFEFKTISSFQLTSDGGYIMAGAKSVTNAINTSPDFWIVKLSSSGIIEWEKTYGGMDQDYARTIQLTSDGGYIVGGITNSNNGDVLVYHGSADIWVLKLSNLGVLEWQKTLGGMNEDQVNAIQQTSDGGYILAGFTSSNGIDVSGNHGNNDVWIIKISSLGLLEWQKAYGGTSIDEANSIEKTTDGGYIITGLTYSNNGDVVGNHGNIDVWLIKISNNGVLLWQKAMGGTNSDYAYSIDVSPNGDYIVAGNTFSTDGDVIGTHGGQDAWVVKLGPGLATSTFNNQLLTLYPNPAKTILQLQSSNDIAFNKIIITDSTGKIVVEQTANTNQINVEKLALGMYSIEAYSGEGKFNSKFIKN